MKRIFVTGIVLLSAVVAYAEETEQQTKATARQKFDQKYEEVFGQKPSEKVWNLSANPNCNCRGTDCRTACNSNL